MLDNKYTEGVMDNQDLYTNIGNPAPVSAQPGDVSDFDGIVLPPEMDNPGIDAFGFSNDDDLNQLRNKHPFVQIDPPFSTSQCFNINFGDAEVIAEVPQWAKIYRVTYQTNAVAALLLMSHDRGIPFVLATSGTFDNVIASPAPEWRYCEGVQQVVFKHIGASGRVFVSIEFVGQV